MFEFMLFNLTDFLIDIISDSFRNEAEYSELPNK